MMVIIKRDVHYFIPVFLTSNVEGGIRKIRHSKNPLKSFSKVDACEAIMPFYCLSCG